LVRTMASRLCPQQPSSVNTLPVRVHRAKAGSCRPATHQLVRGLGVRRARTCAVWVKYIDLVCRRSGPLVCT
jgi:hypothetical protein